ncbi:MAG TPA: GNAT family N-acetyltransferase [Kofleriaceae bacterium]|nr:GNAT family N-acetyltransferase [Kofleriaceae bacterium]
MSVTVREATPADAAVLIAHLQELVGEPGINIPLAPDEVTMTVEQEKAILADFAASPRALMLVATGTEGGVSQIVGELSLKAISSRKAVQHVATLGMSVKQGWRRKGVGRELITAALEWAPSAGIKRVELYVYARNVPAIALYEKCGFAIEGRRTAFIREGETFLDDLVMAKIL